MGVIAYEYALVKTMLRAMNEADFWIAAGSR
jgi:hypothetical protein